MRPNDQLRRTRAASTALTLVVAMLLTIVESRAVPRVVLLVEDARGMPIISGESTEPNHLGWIDAIAIGTGFDKLPTGGAGYAARRARLVVPDAFVVTKKPDRSSPRFQEALLKGEEFPVVRVKYLTGAVRPPSEPITIELRQVRVVDYEIGSGGAPLGAIPTELVGLSFREIRWIYRFRDPTTGEEVEEKSMWDSAYTTDSPDEDSDGDGISNADDPDDDNDGAPDDEELEALLNPLVDDMRFDFDEDGDLNIDEWLAGTDPNSGHSFFAIDSLGLRDNQGRLAATIRLPVVGGRVFRLLGAFSLSDPEGWFVLGEFPIPAGTPAGMVELELPPGVIPMLPRLFIKAAVELGGGPAGNAQR